MVKYGTIINCNLQNPLGEGGGTFSFKMSILVKIKTIGTVKASEKWTKLVSLL